MVLTVVVFTLSCGRIVFICPVWFVYIQTQSHNNTAAAPSQAMQVPCISFSNVVGKIVFDRQYLKWQVVQYIGGINLPDFLFQA